MSRLRKMWVGFMGKLQTTVNSKFLPGTRKVFTELPRARKKWKNEGMVDRFF